METEAYGAHVATVDGSIAEAGRLARLRRGARLVPLCHLQRALPRRGQEDDGVRDRGTARLAPPRRHPLPDRRWHRHRGHVEGVRRDGEDGLRRAQRPRMFAVQAEGCAPIVKAFEEGRDDCPLWATPPPTPTACACPSRSRTSSSCAVSAKAAARPSPSPSRDRPRREGRRPGRGALMAAEAGACVTAPRKLKASGQLSPDDTSSSSTPAPASSTSRTPSRPGFGSRRAHSQRSS